MFLLGDVPASREEIFNDVAFSFGDVSVSGDKITYESIGVASRVKGSVFMRVLDMVLAVGFEGLGCSEISP